MISRRFAYTLLPGVEAVIGIIPLNIAIVSMFLHGDADMDDDRQLLLHLIAALNAVGSQLDAADKLRAYDPWHNIAGLEKHIKEQTARLSDYFHEACPDLVKHMISQNLHISWGNLKQQLQFIVENMDYQKGCTNGP